MKPSAARWAIFWVLALGYILVYFHRLCTAVVAVDMMNDLSAGATLIGVLASAYFYPYALMQLPAGLLADSLGPRRTITIFFFMAGIGSALMGTAQTATVAIAGRLLVGVGVAMLFVPTLKILAAWFTPREFSSVTGILIAMGGVGSLTAAAPLAFSAERIGWRMSFMAVAALTFFSALFIWLIVRDSPEEKISSGSSPETPLKIAPIGLLHGVRMVLSEPRFWPLALWFFFTSAIFFSYGGLWGGPYLSHVYGMNRAAAGNVLSMIALGMIVGSPLHSFLSERAFRGRKPVIILCGVFTLALTAALAFFTESTSSLGSLLNHLRHGILRQRHSGDRLYRFQGDVSCLHRGYRHGAGELLSLHGRGRLPAGSRVHPGCFRKDGRGIYRYGI